MRRVCPLKKARSLVSEPAKTFRRAQPAMNEKVFKRQTSELGRQALAEPTP
jgi:hypothetical protein